MALTVSIFDANALLSTAAKKVDFVWLIVTFTTLGSLVYGAGDLVTVIGSVEAL